MKRELTRRLSLAAATAFSVALLCPVGVRAQNTPDAQTATPTGAQTQSGTQTQSGMQTQTNAQAQTTAQASQGGAMDMVSARVAMKETIDASKVKPGDPIKTELAKKVVLKNGSELPAGTTILGVVGTDDMQMEGTSKLVLNFNKAQLKNGTVIPIKATIVGIYPPESQDISGRPIAPGDQVTQAWSGHPDEVEEIGALPGVDLHSKVTSNNSGVLVSKSKHDMKLRYGSEIALAVAPEQTSGI
jgi:hypothetical protein